MVHEARAIERDLGDARRLRSLRNRGADGLGRLHVAGGLEALGDLLLHGRSRGQYLGAGGIEHLRIHVLRRAMDRQAGDAELADLHAGLDGAALAPLFLGDLHM